MDPKLHRLLRAAANAADDAPAEMPFGFDTRVLATWRSLRSENGSEFWAFARVFRRVAVGAVVIMACAGAGTWWQFQTSDDLDETTSDAYAVADSVIDAGTYQ